MMPWVIEVACTTLLRIAVPRAVAEAGSPAPACAVAAPYAWMRCRTCPSPDLHMLPDQVRGDLAAHPQKGGDEGEAHFAAHDSGSLDGRTEGQGILWTQVRGSRRHRAGERETLAHGLQHLRRQKLVRAPGGGHGMRHHETADADQDESAGGDEARGPCAACCSRRSGRSQSCGTASQISVCPTSSERYPRTVIRILGDQIGRGQDGSGRRKPTRISSRGSGAVKATLKFTPGLTERRSLMTNAASSTTPEHSNAQMSPEFCQSSRLPWSSAA